jgi:hypothetical protein
MNAADMSAGTPVPASNPGIVDSDARSMTSEFFCGNPPPGVQNFMQVGSQVAQPAVPVANTQEGDTISLPLPPGMVAAPQVAAPEPAAVTAAPATTPTPAQLSERFSKTPQELVKPVAAPPHAEDPPEQLSVDSTGRPDSRAAHAYATLRSENSKFKRDVIPALEAAKAAAEKQVAELAETKKQLEAERESLSEKVGQLSITESHEFKEKYDGRASAIHSKLAKALVKYAKITEEQSGGLASGLLEIAGDPEVLAQKTEDMHPAVAGAAILAAQEWSQLDEERKQEVANWRQTGLANVVSGAREAVVKSAEERQRMAEDALTFTRNSGNPLFNPDTANPESVQRAADIAEAFRGFARSASQEDLMKAAADGFAAPLVYEELASERARADELDRQLQGFRRASGVPVVPWARSAAPVAPPVQPSNVAPAQSGDDDPTTFAKNAAARVLGGYQQTVRNHG